MRILHIVNPVLIGEQSDLFIAQPITFASMRNAKSASIRPKVEFSAVCYREDQDVVPSFFGYTTLLRRSVIDVIEDTGANRKLPLLCDLIEKGGLHAEPDDYIVFTNVDIGLQPLFYNFVADQISNGTTSMVINRRTLSDKYTSPYELPDIIADPGKPHPGYDCFVFPAKLLPHLDLGLVCVGAVKVGLVLYLNLRLLDSSFKEFDQEHLTFHIGNDQQWKLESSNIYARHNTSDFNALKKRLAKQHGSAVLEIMQSSFPSLKDKAD